MITEDLVADHNNTQSASPLEESPHAPLQSQLEHQNKAFCIPDYLIHGAFDFSPSEGDLTNVDLQIPFISQMVSDQVGHMADWSGEYQSSGQAINAAAEEDGPWSFASFLESGKVGGLAGRRNSRTGPPAGPSATGARVPSAVWGRKAPWAGSAIRRIIREPSVPIESTWKLVDEIEFSRLSKLSFAPEDPKLLTSVGIAPVIDPSFDRLQAKQERPLGSLESTPLKSPSLLSDRTLDGLISEELQANRRVIVSSDIILSALMACARTILPWDIFMIRHPEYKEGVLVIDKREASDLDQILVNETKSDGSLAEENKDSINSLANLSIEATRITANLPFLLSSKGSAESGKQRTNYVRWDMGDGLVLLVRGQVSATLADKSVLLRSLLEYEWGRGALDWRQRLDVQRASVLTGELKNNSAQITRWICSAVLLSVDLLKIAFVSRLSPRDRTRHAILALHDIEPYEFANQMGIDLSNGFGIVKTLALRFIDGEDGMVVILRDPQKALLRVYQTPAA